MNELQKLEMRKKIYTLEFQKADLELKKCDLDEQLIKIKESLTIEKQAMQDQKEEIKPAVINKESEKKAPIQVQKSELKAQVPEELHDNDKNKKKISLVRKNVHRNGQVISPEMVVSGDRIKIYDQDFNCYVQYRGSDDLIAIGKMFTVYNRDYIFVKSAKEVNTGD